MLVGIGLPSEPSEMLTQSTTTLLRIALGALILATIPQPTHACGLCFVLPEQSLLDKIESSDRALVAHAVATPADSWKMLRVLKGDEIATDVPVAVSTREAALLSDGPQILLWDPLAKRWTIEGPATATLVEFLEGALELTNQPAESITERAALLRYFLPYLEHADRRIANAVHNKLANAPYAALKELAGQMESQELLGWILAQGTHINRRGALYVMWLGHFEDAASKTTLQEWIDEGRGSNNPPHLEALLTAYIEQQGEQAVQFVEQHYVLNRDVSLDKIAAAINSLRTHGNAQTKVSRERITVSFRRLLNDRPALVELVIDDLARWEDWSVAQSLMAIHASGKQPWNNAKIIEFLQQCPLAEAQQFVQVQPSPARR